MKQAIIGGVVAAVLVVALLAAQGRLSEASDSGLPGPTPGHVDTYHPYNPSSTDKAWPSVEADPFGPAKHPTVVVDDHPFGEPQPTIDLGTWP